MRVKQRTVCQTCRAQKLGCDGKQPECGQCKLRDRHCHWNSHGWTFVSQNARASGPRKDAKGCQGQAEFRQLPPSEPGMFGSGPWYDSRIKSIVDAFVPQEELSSILQDSKDVPRICGAWVGVLPELVQHRQPHSDRALSLSIEALFSGVTVKPCAASIQAYNAAIEAVREAITPPKHLENTAEVATAIMCLTLSELFLPDSHFGLAMHFNGIAHIFQSSGPDRFRTGVLHSLFAGFRPLFMVQAFQSRQATFIDSDEWTRGPFSDRCPSTMQALISRAAHLPSLLQQTDTLLASPQDGHQACTLHQDFVDLFSAMESWEKSLRSHHPGSIRDSDTDEGRPDPERIWFSDITMANLYTHLWAFRIVCATEISRLVALFPLTNFHDSPTCDAFSSATVQEHNEALATLICRSMGYLMQDGFKLYGPLSTMLPLQTACQVFLADRSKNTRQVAHVKALVEDLVKKGIRSAPSIIYH